MKRKKDLCAVALFMREINHMPQNTKYQVIPHNTMQYHAIPCNNVLHVSFVSNVMCVLFVSYVPNVLHRSLLLFVFDVM